VLALAASLFAADTSAQLELSAVRVASGLSAPMTVAAPAGDPRLFVVERGGTIRVLSGGALLPAAFLDVSDRVETQGEGGLLGLAFPDDYLESGRFFVYYTAPDETAPGDLESRVSRFTVSGDPATSNDADEASEQIFFTLDQPYDNHNGGTIAIRDGWLYLGLGDGGDGGDPQDRAQDDGSLLGKMLRFDLADATPPWAPAVWAKGLRNPFRFSFDRQNGDLYIGDVGQNALEEIDAERADDAGGRNYGWDVEEGTACFDPDPGIGEPPCGDPSLVEPIFEYAHEGAFCSGSVTGGAVYRGEASPALRGLYFFADYCQDRIWSLRWNRDTGLAEEVDERTGEIPTDFGTIENLTAIAEDGAGELHLVDAGGEVFRLVPEPGAGASGAAAALGLAALRRRRAASGRRPGC
jgi:glucose/arabinose dehydrogenase